MVAGELGSVPTVAHSAAFLLQLTGLAACKTSGVQAYMRLCARFLNERASRASGSDKKNSTTDYYTTHKIIQTSEPTLTCGLGRICCEVHRLHPP